MMISSGESAHQQAAPSPRQTDLSGKAKSKRTKNGADDRTSQPYKSQAAAPLPPRPLPRRPDLHNQPSPKPQPTNIMKLSAPLLTLVALLATGLANPVPAPEPEATLEKRCKANGGTPYPLTQPPLCENKMELTPTQQPSAPTWRARASAARAAARGPAGSAGRGCAGRRTTVRIEGFAGKGRRRLQRQWRAGDIVG